MSDKLNAVFHGKRLELFDHVEVIVVGLWNNRSLKDRSFVPQAASVVVGAQRTIQDLVAAYCSLTVQAAIGSEFEAVKPKVEWPSYKDMRGVDPMDVYGRPFGTFFVKLAEGSSRVEANSAASAYIEKLVSVDMQLAQTHATRAWMDAYAELSRNHGEDRARGESR